MNTERLVAIVRLVVPLVVAIANMAGYALDAGLVANIAMTVATIAAFVWAWWKNNNVTEAAQIAQEYLDALKAGMESEEYSNALTIDSSASDDDSRME